MASSASVRRLECATRIDTQGSLTLVSCRKGSIRETSPEVAALLRVERMQGKLMIAFVARGDTRAFREWLRALHLPGSSRSICVRLRPRGHHPFRACLSAVDIVDATGFVLGLRWTIRRVACAEDPASGKPVGESVEEAVPESSARLSVRALRVSAGPDVA